MLLRVPLICATPNFMQGAVTAILPYTYGRQTLRELLDGFGAVLGLLIFVPLIGGASGIAVASIWSVCDDPQTPKWQAYLWCWALGAVVCYGFGLSW